MQPPLQHPPRDPAGPGQESVWDYPRPPALRPSAAHVVVQTPDGRVLADTTAALQVLETSHPPGWYLPPGDIDRTLLRPSRARSTVCEWKGAAVYWDLLLGDRIIEQVGWSYPDPVPAFAAIAGHLTFYADRVGRCLVDGEVVAPQPGEFYGGWITPDVVGPFKGTPGTMWW